jgi:hypothetical protein
MHYLTSWESSLNVNVSGNNDKWFGPDGTDISKRLDEEARQRSEQTGEDFMTSRTNVFVALANHYTDLLEDSIGLVADISGIKE